MPKLAPPARNRPRLVRSCLSALFLLTLGAGGPLSGGDALAGNLLTNPGFEADPSGHTQTIVGWTSYGPNNYGQTDAGSAHAGSNYFKVYQGFTSSVNYSGIYQDNASGPGAVYNADGWAFTASGDTLAGQNVAWIEVTFRDARGNMLALYRSAAINTNAIATGAFPPDAWIQLPVTNQYHPVNFQFLGTVSSLVAPPGTSYVRYQIVLQGDAQNSGGSLHLDDLNLIRASAAPYGDWNIVWSDEFDGSAINTNIWTFDIGNGASGWGNNELEYYTRSPQNAYVSNGLLHIVARQQVTNGFQYTSARMKTQDLFSRAFGRFEFRAKLPAGVGFWPALWMLGTNFPSVGWPACGEIDIMENRGGNLTNVQGTLHFGSSLTSTYTLPGGSVTNFHTYMLEWTSNAFNWYVDGIRFQTQTSWSGSLGPYPAPFDRPFFLIMNLAVGGNYLGNPSISTINANSTFPGDMQVDYVRIYDHTAPLELSIAPDDSDVKVSWPGTIVCHLQVQTNSLAGGLSSGWVDVPGATNPWTVTPVDGSSFYRLVSP